MLTLTLTRRLIGACDDVHAAAVHLVRVRVRVMG